MRLELVAYDRSFLDLSWTWLHDPTIKALTMAPDFTRAAQEEFFAALPTRTDYHIWGVRLLPDRPIGVAGIKDVRGKDGEYWGYIGEQSCWGQGLGRDMLELVEDQAQRLGLSTLKLLVEAGNTRAMTLYGKVGYQEQSRSEGRVQMLKSLKCN